MGHEARRSRLVLLAALAAAGAACVRLAPVVPMHARTADVDLGMDHLRLGPVPARALVFHVDSTVPHEIGHAWLTVATRDPCSGGSEADQISIDGGNPLLHTLWPGRHMLTVRFADTDTLKDATLDTVFDLELEDDVCVRAPAVSQSVPLRVRDRPMLVTALNVHGNGDLAGLRAFTDAELGAGGSVGPLLLTGQVGIGQTICNEGTCGRDSMGNLRNARMFALSAEARYAFEAVTINMITSAFSVGARYAYLPVTLPAMGGDERFSVHAIDGVLAWSMTDALRGPFQHLERVLPIEFAVPIGVVIGPVGSTQRRVLAGGIELRLLLPL